MISDIYLTSLTFLFYMILQKYIFLAQKMRYLSGIWYFLRKVIQLSTWSNLSLQPNRSLLTIFYVYFIIIIQMTCIFVKLWRYYGSADLFNCRGRANSWNLFWKSTFNLWIWVCINMRTFSCKIYNSLMTQNNDTFWIKENYV